MGRSPAAGWPRAIECLHYALSLPTSVVITGCDSMERLEQAFHAIETFKPMSGEQVERYWPRRRPRQ